MKEETRRNKERIETDNNMEPAMPFTETKQYQPFDTSLIKLHEREEMGGVVVHGHKEGKREMAPLWLGEGGIEADLRGEALRTWKAIDQKREPKERTATVTVGEMRVIAVYPPV